MPEITLTQGQRIRYAREKAGLEQEDLAAFLRVGRSSISMWEKDKNKKGVSYSQLLRIAEATEMPIEFFEEKEARFSMTVSGRYEDQLALFDEFDQASAGIWHPSYASAA